MPRLPQQIEFARLNLTYTLMSKRRLLELVQEKATCRGWDDPRMPTIAGLRRRGYTPEAIRAFADPSAWPSGTAWRTWPAGALRARGPEREGQRAMAVLRPLKLVIDELSRRRVRGLDAANHPDDPQTGRRKVPFGRELFIEQEDFQETRPRSCSGWPRGAKCG